MESTIGTRGTLIAKKHKTAVGPGLRWKLKNTLRFGFLWGWLTNWLAIWFSRLTGIRTIRSELRARKNHPDGTIVDFGVLGYREVTDAGVAFLVDDWDDDSTDITDFDYHGCGTVNTAEDQTQTALEGEVGTATVTREAGTATQPNAYDLLSTATQAFSGSAAVVEHGLFSADTGGTMWDRTMFATITVANGESITWAYTVTFTAGS